MLLSTREKEIVKILIRYRDTYIKIYDIAQQLAVSSRTIHRELKDVESYLNEFSIELERVAKKGIKLNYDTLSLNQLKINISQHQTVDLSLEEQKVIIMYTLIQATEPVKQFTLAHEIGVSNQTLSKLLDELDIEISNYQLSIIRKRGEGIILFGAESKKREFLSQLMVNNLNSTSVYSVIENHFVYQSLHQTQQSLVDLDKIFKIERVLMDDLGRLPYSLTESSYLTLTVHIVLSIDRMQKNEFVTLDEEIFNEVKDTFEYQVASDISERLEKIYDVEFNQAEITFITIHLRGAKRKDIRTDTKDSYESIKQFIDEVERLYHHTFDDKETLIEGLTLHIHPAINRLNSNIETYNPLTQMIKHKYPGLFNTITSALQTIWPNLKFPESEIAFIVLHFGGSLRKQQQNNQLQLLVVCSSGIGTSRLLATRLKDTFTNIDSIQQASVSDLNHLDLKVFDAIISTVNLDINNPFIVVNPLLPDNDIEYVSNFLKSDYQRNNANVPTINEQDYHSNNEQIFEFIRKGLTLIDSISFEYGNVDNWKDNLIQSLSSNHSITDTESFAELLQDKLEVNRSWVLDPYPIAIPHLRHDSIQSPLIQINILREPIYLRSNQNDKVKIEYLMSMFIPNDEDMAKLISSLVQSLTYHLDSIDEFMKKPHEVKSILKTEYLNELKKQLY